MRVCVFRIKYFVKFYKVVFSRIKLVWFNLYIAFDLYEQYED